MRKCINFVAILSCHDVLCTSGTGRSRGALASRRAFLRHSGSESSQPFAEFKHDLCCALFSQLFTVHLPFVWPQVRNSLGLAEEDEDEEGGGSNGSLAKLWGKKLKNRERSYSRAELASLWSLLQQEEYTFLR